MADRQRRAVELLQTFDADLLADVARLELDLNALARQELANRGLDWNGKWVGFPKAREIAKYHPVRTARGVIAVSIPE